MLSRDQRPGGSQPAFAWDNIEIPIQPITDWRSLFPPSSTRSPIAGLTALPSSMRKATGLPCSACLTIMDGLGSFFPPVVFNAHDEGNFNPRTHHIAFWLKPVSTFGLFVHNGVYQRFT